MYRMSQMMIGNKKYFLSRKLFKNVYSTSCLSSVLLTTDVSNFSSQQKPSSSMSDACSVLASSILTLNSGVSVGPQGKDSVPQE